MRVHTQQQSAESLRRVEAPSFMPRAESRQQWRNPLGAIRNDFRWNEPAGRLPMIQPKLRINAPNDRYEQEADTIADRVLTGGNVDTGAITSVDGGVLQRTCSCGGSGTCDECKKKNDDERIQRKSLGTMPQGNEASVRSVASGGGEAMRGDVRGFFEDRMGMSFDHVRIHKGASAAESARALEARAYTSGRDIVFGEGEYRPETDSGKRLIAHELVHVAQQGGESRGAPYRSVQERGSESGGRRFAFGPTMEQEPPQLESQADSFASSVLAGGLSGGERSTLQSTGTHADLLQRYRIPLPVSVPLCGREVTHIDIEAPRWRELEGGACDQFIPPGTLVNRMNIVGRQVTAATQGNGRIVFNLHIGYYRHPVTGRYCAVVDDSKECLCGRCALHVCFLTPQEVLEAVWEFLKKALEILGWLALAVLLAALLVELSGLILAPVALADNEGTGDGGSHGPTSPTDAGMSGAA